MDADVGRLLAGLEARDELSEIERSAITTAPWRVRPYEAGQVMVRQGSEPKQSCLLIEGYTGRSKIFMDGRRQITSIHVPGDFVDLHAILLKVMDHEVVALTPVTVAFIDHSYFHALTERTHTYGALCPR